LGTLSTGVSPSASAAVTQVQGTWVVPAIVSSGGSGFGGSNAYGNGNAGNFGSPGTTCSDNENTWYDNSDWVGIDGFVSQTVEQTGTSSDCYYGQAYYYAWYEFYPANSVAITSIDVHAGDTMTAAVNCVPAAPSSPTYPSATCTTTITDARTHQSYTSPATFVPGALTDSAEWIAESAYYEGFLALTQTNPVQFSGATATIGGVTHGISGWGSNVYWLLMVDYNFGVNQETGVATPSTATLGYAKADTSALGRGGDNFNVQWLSSGP
jgi:Peptidase A4 family